MTLYEPTTLLTDCLLAALAGWFAWRLHRQRPAANLAQRWWSRTLGLTAVSALVGGTSHGFGPNFPPAVADAWWLATLLVIFLISAAMAMSLLHEIVPAEKQGPWRALIAVKLAGFTGAAILKPVFVVAIVDYGLAMVAWAAAALILRPVWRNWMLAAIGLSVIAAIVQQLQWPQFSCFNYNDLFHVIQALALVGFYRAARLLTARPSP
jgi:MFS family permease